MGKHEIRVGCDVDGVLADFHKSFIDYIVKVTGKDLFPPRGFEIVVWDYPQHHGYTNEEVSMVWKEIRQDPSFWADLEPYDDTQEFLKELGTITNQVVFITDRNGIDPETQTICWLKKWGWKDPIVLISGKKDECCERLRISHYIDDRIENCEKVRDNTSTECYMLTRPWNRPIHSVARIPSLQAFLDVLKHAN